MAFIAHKQEEHRLKVLLTKEAKNSKPASTQSFLNWNIPGILKNSFVAAGYDTRKASKFILLQISSIFFVVLFSLTTGKFQFLIAVLLIILFGIIKIKRSIFNRAELFERDYTALLVSLAASVRTGMDPLVALSSSAELFSKDSEMYKELEIMRKSISAGVSEDRLIMSFADTINHPDIGLFRTALLIARKEGGSLASCLQRLTKVTRQRQSFRRKIRSAVAMQKLSAFGIASCTVLIGVFQAITNYAALKNAYNHPMGFKIIAASVGAVILGLVWMNQVTKAKL